jgi:hypothetical protein
MRSTFTPADGPANCMTCWTGEAAMVSGTIPLSSGVGWIGTARDTHRPVRASPRDALGVRGQWLPAERHRQGGSEGQGQGRPGFLAHSHRDLPLPSHVTSSLAARLSVRELELGRSTPVCPASPDIGIPLRHYRPNVRGQITNSGEVVVDAPSTWRSTRSATRLAAAPGWRAVSTVNGQADAINVARHSVGWLPAPRRRWALNPIPAGHPGQ